MNIKLDSNKIKNLDAISSELSNKEYILEHNIILDKLSIS